MVEEIDTPSSDSLVAEEVPTSPSMGELVFDLSKDKSLLFIILKIIKLLDPILDTSL